MDDEERISSESSLVRSADLYQRANCFSTNMTQYESCLNGGGDGLPTPYRFFLCATLQPTFRSDEFWACVKNDSL